MKFSRRAFWIFILWIPLVVAGLSGCSSVPPNAAEEQTGKPSFPVKSIAENAFSFDSIDKKWAIRAYQLARADLLFELVIDREGKVLKIRVVRTKLDTYMTAGFKVHVSDGMKFTPASSSDPLPYRTLYYPFSTTTEIIER